MQLDIQISLTTTLIWGKTWKIAHLGKIATLVLSVTYLIT